MIEIHDWSRSATLGGDAIVTFRVGARNGAGRPSRPVVELRLDARGDGQPGVTVRGTDLRAVTGLRLPMTVAGTHSLHVGVVDAAGCSDETAARRAVVVQ